VIRWPRVAQSSFICCLLSVPAFADIAVTQLGPTAGDDWEPAIAADGQNVYAAWAHFGSAGMTDSTGATCMTTAGSYTYFQRSTNGGTSWMPYIIPRCPVSGTQIDFQVAIGPNHRVYVSYMDGPQANSTIQVIYSDDFGVTWSVPVNAAGSGGGDKDILLVDSGGAIMMMYEHLSNNYITYTPNIATTPFTQKRITPPGNTKSGTSLATGGVLDSKGNAYFSLVDATSNAKGDSYFWIVRSNDHFNTWTVTTVDRSFAQPGGTGAGWDYWGGSIQIATVAEPVGTNDRVVVVYNAGTTAGGAERIYTKYSDSLGATWNIAYNPNSYPNGTDISAAPVGAWHGFMSIAGTSAGVKAIWQDNRVQYPCTSSTTAGACGLWNVYERGSTDGATWGAESKMTLPLTHSYQVPSPAPGGFYHPYGDYSWTTTDGAGNTWAVWGEGTSYNGPGTVYAAKF
jgi:hypothetical protein